MLISNHLNSHFISVNGVGAARPTAWLRVSGPDATVFLQGQCTQELRGLKIGQTAPALWLTMKGKVMGESLVLRVEAETWWLWSAHTTGDALKARLDEFIIADDVTVEESSDWEQTTLAGGVAAEWLREVRDGREPPAPGWAEAWCGGWLFAGRRGQTQVWDWVYPTREGEALKTRLVPPAEALGTLAEEDLRRGRLLAGVPAIPGEFGPGDLPQEAGLETVAISFTKGCYLGQEVMARLHAMGQVRRRLVRVTGPGTTPATGAELRQKEKRVGELRASVRLAAEPGNPTPLPRWLGLAMVNLLGLDLAAEIKLGDGCVVTVIDSP